MLVSFASGNMCIQPTYEELKHQIINPLAKDIFRIQPTYEELKRNVLCHTEQHVLGIQPTYEELKHGNRKHYRVVGAWYPAYL